MNIKQFITGYKGKDIPKELKEFNWGAFLLTFIWGVKYKAWITLLAIPLIWFQLPLGINWLLYTILQFYCGIKGNEWAYQEEWWKKPQDFRKTQAKWAICAIALNIIIPFAVLSIAARFINKSQDNPAEFIQNALCVVSYNKLKSGLKRVQLTTTTTEAEVANQFAQNFNNATDENNYVKFLVKSSGKEIEAYNIKFHKKNDEICDITKQNCAAQSSYIMPTDVMSFGECNFYFNNRKEVEPSKPTKEAIDKGFNIFKYL